MSTHPYKESGSGFCGICDDMPGEGQHALPPKEEEGVGTPTPLQNFYVTFGVKYRHTTHPVWPGAHPDGYLQVIAPDEEAARLLVRRSIGPFYAFMYTEDRFDASWCPMGRLAVIYEDGSSAVERNVNGGNANPPLTRLTESDPQWHGREGFHNVGVRVEGVLATDPSLEMYDVEYLHYPCIVEGVALFERVNQIDGSVHAGELDWAALPTCPVCDREIS